MNILVKIILLILAITFYSTAIASGTTNTKPLMAFQVIQTQLVIDKSMIESALILPPAKPSDLYGLQLKFKDAAAKELARVSEENIGKQMNFVLGRVVVSSPTIQSKLEAELQIFGLTKSQAEQFIKNYEH